MPITGTNPLVINKSYDSYWLNLNTIAPSPDKKAMISVSLLPYDSTAKEDGTHDCADKAITFRINDLFAEAATNTELAAALQAVETAVQNIARTKGLI